MRLGPMLRLRLVAPTSAPASPAAAPATLLLAELLAMLGRRGVFGCRAWRRLFRLLGLLLVVLLDRRRKLHRRGGNHRRFLGGEVAQPLETEGGRDQRVVMRDRDAKVVAQLDLRQGLPVLIK